MSDEPKTCLRCYHCRLSAPEGPWSEYTPGESGHWSCDKGHWWMDEEACFDPETILMTTSKAASCPDYQRPKP